MSHLRDHRRLMHYYGRELFRSLFEPIYMFLSLTSATVNLLGAAAFCLLENSQRPIPLSFFDAVFFSVSTTTGVGCSSIAPLTAGGKLVAMAMMLLGTAIFAAFTATLAATLLDLEMKRRGAKS